MFAPGLKGIKDHWTGHGKLKGRISNFESKKLTINFGKRSRIHGEIGLDGIPIEIILKERSHLQDKYRDQGGLPGEIKDKMAQNRQRSKWRSKKYRRKH